MGIWRVIGSARLHNLAAKSILVFNSTPCGNELVGIHVSRMYQTDKRYPFYNGSDARPWFSCFGKYDYRTSDVARRRPDLGTGAIGCTRLEQQLVDCQAVGCCCLFVPSLQGILAL
eukprot:scaffold162378_cov19-Tisochrysis_lutea.AAC.2